MFNVIREEHTNKVTGFMLDMMTPLITEADSVSQEMLDVVLVNIVEPIKVMTVGKRFCKRENGDLYYCCKQKVMCLVWKLKPSLSVAKQACLQPGKGSHPTNWQCSGTIHPKRKVLYRTLCLAPWHPDISQPCGQTLIITVLFVRKLVPWQVIGKQHLEKLCVCMSKDWAMPSSVDVGLGCPTFLTPSKPASIFGLPVQYSFV